MKTISLVIAALLFSETFASMVPYKLESDTKGKKSSKSHKAAPIKTERFVDGGDLNGAPVIGVVT